MFSKKFNLVFIFVIIFLLSVASMVQAAPPAQTPTDDGSSLGDTLDMDKFNLGSVMSGNEGTPEATTEPAVEPTVEPTGEPTAEPTGEPTVEPTGEPTTEPTEEAGQQHPVASALADYFGVPYDEIMSLHEAGNGFGNIARAYFFADRLGMEPSALLEAAHGSGWGNVLRDAGVQANSGHGNRPDREGPPGQTRRDDTETPEVGGQDNGNEHNNGNGHQGNDNNGQGNGHGGGKKDK